MKELWKSAFLIVKISHFSTISHINAWFFQCRERGSSYTAQLQVSCKYQINNGESSGFVLKNIADVPIMVKVRCTIQRSTKCLFNAHLNKTCIAVRALGHQNVYDVWWKNFDQISYRMCLLKIRLYMPGMMILYGEQHFCLDIKGWKINCHHSQDAP